MTDPQPPPSRDAATLAAIPVFWLFVMVLAAVLSLLNRLTAVAGGVRLVPVLAGFFLQFPVVASVALLHALVELCCRWLPRRIAAAVSLAGTSFLVFVCLAFLAASEYNLRALGTYLTFDVFRIVFTDFRQVVLGVWHDSRAGLLSLLVASPAAWLLLRALPRLKAKMPLRPGGRPRVVFAATMAALGLATAAAAAVLLPAPLRPDGLPVAYATAALWKAWGGGGQGGAPSRPQELKPISSLADYRYANPSLRATPPVFIILVEAVSSDHAGFNGYFRRDITPNIDALAADSLAFVNAYAPSNHSNYAQTSIHASQYARRRNYLDMFADVGYPRTLLFDILGTYGYQTAFVSSQNERWQGMINFVRTGSKIDFFFHSPDALGRNIPSEMKLDDAFTRSVAEDFIRRRDRQRPLFLYLNFQKTHFPYDLPRGADVHYAPAEVDFSPYTFFRYPREKVEIVRNRYDNALRYMDEQVGRFIAFLKQEGLCDEALVILAPDHGEAFYEKGFPTHGTSLLDDQVRTFLLVKLPRGAVRGNRRDAVSLIDINPTVLEVLGLPNHDNFQGEQVIWNNPRDRRIFMTAQGVIHSDGVVQFPWKFISVKQAGLALLNVEMDPSESVDLSARFPEKRRELEAALERHIAAQLGYYGNAELTARFFPPRTE